MLKNTIIKDLRLIIQNKMFWLFELIFIVMGCMVSFISGIQFADTNFLLFRLSFPLTMSYASLTFIPIGDFHREQSNGCFSYLMGINMDLKTYIYSKGIVMGFISFIPSFLFIVLGLSSMDILIVTIISILVLIYSLNISFWYAYEIIVSTNPVKTMGQASMITIVLFILIALFTKIRINASILIFLIIIFYAVNIISFYVCISKIRNLSTDSIFCRR